MRCLAARADPAHSTRSLMLETNATLRTGAAA